MAVTTVRNGRTPYQPVNPIYGGDYPLVAPPEPAQYAAQEALNKAQVTGSPAYLPGRSASVGGTAAQILPAHS